MRLLLSRVMVLVELSGLTACTVVTLWIYLYHCTVHSVAYLINTPTNAHIFM